MASSFEKSVKGATKIKAAPPKTKYIEHILIATHAGEAGVGEVFRSLQNRLRDSTWTVVFKSLITVHLMIREGSPDVTLNYLARHRNTLAISMFSDAQTQGRNIRHYSEYLNERARAYKETRCDWVRAKESRLEKLSIDKGLLRETEIVQHQLTALLKCNVLETEQENEITVTVFRLLVLDLLALFRILNQAMINILGHFFEMSKVDAERAMAIYRTFTRQTDYVVQYLGVARQYEHRTRVEVPKLRHAPVNLGRQLEDYLKDPDFEINRRQYLAELDAKKNKAGGSAKRFGAGAEVASKSTTSKGAGTATNGAGASKSSQPAAENPPEPNLIDFFDFIEQKQAPVAVQPPIQQQPQQQPQPQVGISPWGAPAPNMGGFQAQPTGQFQAAPGFAPQPTGFQATNPFQQQNMGAFTQQQQQPQQPVMPQFTGVGFGGFTPQQSFQPSTLGSIPQDSVATFPNNNMNNLSTSLSALNLQTGQQQVTNPFRQSMMMTGNGQMANQQLQQQTPMMTGAPAQSTNPFARSTPQAAPLSAPLTNPTPFQSQPPPPLQPMATGTNPFARSNTIVGGQRPATSSAALLPQPTGSTNPFRQGAFVNHATGMGWQHGQGTIGGGLDNLQTIPVFPQPNTSAPWQS